jgi:hypothetical protein
MRRPVTLALAFGLLLATAGSAVAAPKTNCPPSIADWELTTADVLATEIFPVLLEPSDFPTIEDLTTALASYDANGDGYICVKEQGGYNYNPQSHWYQLGIELFGEPVRFWIPRDNNANGS